MNTPSPTRGRLLVLLAAVLWSTNGAFTNALTEPTALGLNSPTVHPLQIAAGRALFAGLALLPLVRRRDISFTPVTAATALTFAAMNAMFISAIALGSSANAILLQYTAPLWLMLLGAWLLGERIDARGALAVAVGLLGVAVLLYGGWSHEAWPVLLLGLGSGVTYAGILLGLRAQRDASPAWITAVNHLTGAGVLLPWVMWIYGVPTAAQVGWLALFGAVQLGLPYLIMAVALKQVSAAEAGTLTLIEPVLSPLWAYLVAPHKEQPTLYHLVGGLCIIGALAYRYWPRAREMKCPPR